MKPAFDRIRELGDKITINQAGSEIDEINAQAGIKPKVSDDIYYLLKEAYDYSVKSEGGFNMAIGAITHYGESALMMPASQSNLRSMKR